MANRRLPTQLNRLPWLPTSLRWQSRRDLQQRCGGQQLVPLRQHRTVELLRGRYHCGNRWRLHGVCFRWDSKIRMCLALGYGMVKNSFRLFAWTIFATNIFCISSTKWSLFISEVWCLVSGSAFPCQQETRKLFLPASSQDTVTFAYYIACFSLREALKITPTY